MRFAHGETVTIETAGTVTDPYSAEDVASWDTPTSITICDCGVASGGSIEPQQDARNAVESDFDVIMPPCTRVTSGSRLIIRGLTCEVVGRPFDWRSPFSGWAPGMLVRAKIVEG